METHTQWKHTHNGNTNTWKHTHMETHTHGNTHARSSPCSSSYVKYTNPDASAYQSKQPYHAHEAHPLSWRARTTRARARTRARTRTGYDTAVASRRNTRKIKKFNMPPEQRVTISGSIATLISQVDTACPRHGGWARPLQQSRVVVRQQQGQGLCRREPQRYEWMRSGFEMCGPGHY